MLQQNIPVLKVLHLLSVDHAKVCLHTCTMDPEFKRYHMDIDSLVNEGEIKREQAVMDLPSFPDLIHNFNFHNNACVFINFFGATCVKGESRFL